MSRTLVLARGGIFRRYAKVTRFTSGEYGSAEYFFFWKSVLASAGHSADSVTQEIFVWNMLHSNWYRVLSVRGN